MCSNYDAVDDETRMLTHFGVGFSNEKEMLRAAQKKRVYPTGLAPFLRLREPGSGNRVVEHGSFGLLPVFAKEIAYGKRTYNARSETVHKLPSFRESWAKGWRCVIPADRVYEPCYETGRSVWHAIERRDGKPLAVAGIYREWIAPAGEQRWSFAMLTVNADGHPTFARMHAPNEEKRMVIILSDEQEQDAWLSCSVEDAPKFFRQTAVPLENYPQGQARRRGPQQGV